MMSEIGICLIQLILRCFISLSTIVLKVIKFYMRSLYLSIASSDVSLLLVGKGSLSPTSFETEFESLLFNDIAQTHCIFT